MRTGTKILVGALVGLCITAPFLALLYLGSVVAGLPFLPYDAFDAVSRELPGDVVTTGIDTMVDALITLGLGEDLDKAAKTSERLMAISGFLVAGMLLGIFFFFLANQLFSENRTSQERLLAVGLAMGFLMAIPMLMVSNNINVSATATPAMRVIWGLLIFLAWGAAYALIYRRLNETTPLMVMTTPVTGEATSPTVIPAPMRESSRVQRIDRRTFLIQLGGTAATLTLVGAGAAELIKMFDGEDIVGGDADLSQFRDVTALLEPAPGTRPEYTPLENHYRIDINIGNGPMIDEADWKLRVTGLVAEPMEMTLEQIRSLPVQKEVITLSCISNRIAGSLISTTQWTGVSMQQILETIQPAPEATHVKITSEDGFYEIVALDLIREDPRIMLAYEWDDVPLPRRHGFPLRIYIPDRYGMKQPKWITRMEFIDSWEPGYWVERGWSREAIVRATSVIDTVAVGSAFEENGKTYIPMGGIAYAGARGISKVEVQVDDGEWVAAKLRTPYSELTWVVWRYDFPMQAGDHRFSVRCYDGSGAMQILETEGNHPDGATGVHSVSQEV